MADAEPEELAVSRLGTLATLYLRQAISKSCTGTGKTAERTGQLDFVFASAEIASRIRVSARNEPEYWGPSDHCRVDITVD